MNYLSKGMLDIAEVKRLGNRYVLLEIRSCSCFLSLRFDDAGAWMRLCSYLIVGILHKRLEYWNLLFIFCAVIFSLLTVFPFELTHIASFSDKPYISGVIIFLSFSVTFPFPATHTILTYLMRAWAVRGDE